MSPEKSCPVSLHDPCASSPALQFCAHTGFSRPEKVSPRAEGCGRQGQPRGPQTVASAQTGSRLRGGPGWMHAGTPASQIRNLTPVGLGPSLPPARELLENRDHFPIHSVSLGPWHTVDIHDTQLCRKGGHHTRQGPRSRPASLAC